MIKTNCESLRDLKKYISEEKPSVDYCLIEINDANYSPRNSWDEIDIPLSQGMRSYLADWCEDLMEDSSDVRLFEVDDALFHDLQYIAEGSHISFDWEELRKKLKPFKSSHIHLILT